MRDSTPRRRRLTRAAVAGVLTAALAATAGLPTATAGASHAAAPDVTLHPGQLERGARTTLLHMQEEVIVDGVLRVPVRGPAHVWLLGRIGHDYLVSTASADFERFTVQLVQPDGDRRVVRRFGDRTTATISANGRHLVMATLVARDTRLRVFHTRSGALVRQRTFGAYGAEVSDYGVRRMVLTGIRGGRTYWWNPATDRLRLLVRRPARADIQVDRLVVLVPNPAAPDVPCQRTVRLSRPSQVLWRSCRDIPLEFSPTARRMVTMDIRTDGIGPRTIHVRRQGGGLVRTYRAPMWFGFTEWESDREVLLQPVGRRFLAAVRCDVRDGCERASRLYEAPGTFDPPETMRWSFPQ
jgi:hypothetical protein